jgi:hypothetical protein
MNKNFIIKLLYLLRAWGLKKISLCFPQSHEENLKGHKVFLCELIENFVAPWEIISPFSTKSQRVTQRPQNISWYT